MALLMKKMKNRNHTRRCVKKFLIKMLSKRELKNVSFDILKKIEDLCWFCNYRD
jgi:hypothetical protein